MSTLPLPLLDWTRPIEWREIVIDAALQEFAPTRDREWLLSHKPDTRYWDVHSWYEPLQMESGIEDHEEFLEAMGAQLPPLFTRVRTVHLCRPLDFETYRTRGIVRLDPKEMQRDFIAFFKSEHPELSEVALQRAIAKANERLEFREARVFLAIDERYMLEQAGHYAVFGSEYQLLIARELGTSNPDYRQTLRRRGRPAYVVVHLPLNTLEAENFKDLAGDLLPTAISSFHLGLEKRFLVAHGFDIPMDVPPDLIHEIVEASHARSHWAT
jgi:hypothetical protein